MNFSSKWFSSFLIMGFTFTNVSFANVTPKSEAIDFTLKSAAGNEVKLSSLKGKWVVLEWHNRDCPFVVKHYETENMQKLQKKYTALGVEWLTINSSAQGKQGYESPADMLKTKKERNSLATHLLIDSDGVVGKKYGAKTTPQMVVINPEQFVVYAGAIDSIPSSNKDDVAKATNYVSAALDEAMNKKPVTIASSKPYGCGVKY